MQPLPLPMRSSGFPKKLVENNHILEAYSMVDYLLPSGYVERVSWGIYIITQKYAMCNTLNVLRLKWSKSGGTTFSLRLKRNFHVKHIFQRNWKSLLATDCAENFRVSIVKYFAMTMDNESVSRQLRNGEGPKHLHLIGYLLGKCSKSCLWRNCPH